MEPGFIEEYPLMSRFPQRPDFLFLPLRRKDVLLHTQPKKVLEHSPTARGETPSGWARPAFVRPMLVRSFSIACPKA